MKYLALMVPLFLVGCGGATIVSSSLPCQPPAEIMTKGDRLAPLTVQNLKMTEIVQAWLADDQKYNMLKNKDDALVEWVNKHCQK